MSKIRSAPVNMVFLVVTNRDHFMKSSENLDFCLSRWSNFFEIESERNSHWNHHFGGSAEPVTDIPVFQVGDPDWLYKGFVVKMIAFFAPKVEDFWVTERLWKFLAERVYQHPRPAHVDALTCRVRESIREVQPEILTSLVHEIPVRTSKIYEMTGRKIPPGWKARNNHGLASTKCVREFSLSTGVCKDTTGVG